VLEYFAPLQAWLKQQNEGQTCGWQATASAATPTASPNATSPNTESPKPTTPTKS